MYANTRGQQCQWLLPAVWPFLSQRKRVDARARESIPSLTKHWNRGGTPQIHRTRPVGTLGALPDPQVLGQSPAPLLPLAPGSGKPEVHSGADFRCAGHARAPGLPGRPSAGRRACNPSRSCMSEGPGLHKKTSARMK